MNTTPDFQLHCSRCPESFYEMTALIAHKERCGQPAKTKQPRPKRTPRKKAVGGR